MHFPTSVWTSLHNLKASRVPEKMLQSSGVLWLQTPVGLNVNLITYFSAKMSFQKLSLPSGQGAGESGTLIVTESGGRGRYTCIKGGHIEKIPSLSVLVPAPYSPQHPRGLPCILPLCQHRHVRSWQSSEHLDWHLNLSEKDEKNGVWASTRAS